MSLPTGPHDTSPLRRRIGRALFPTHPLSQHFDEKTLHTNVGVRLTCMQRLRALLSGRVSVEVRVTTDKRVTQTSACASFNVMPPRWLQ